MPFELLYGLGAAGLAVGIAYAIYQYRTRNRANDAITEAATREQYSHPEDYEATEEHLRRKVRPS